jgi:hypothetical protein
MMRVFSLAIFSWLIWYMVSNGQHGLHFISFPLLSIAPRRDGRFLLSEAEDSLTHAPSSFQPCSNLW